MEESKIVQALSQFLGADISPTMENAHRYRPTLVNAVNQIYNVLGSRRQELFDSLDTIATPEAIKAKKMLSNIYGKQNPTRDAISQIFSNSQGSPIQTAVNRIQDQANRADTVDEAKVQNPLTAATSKAAQSLEQEKDFPYDQDVTGESTIIDNGKLDEKVKRWTPQVTDISKKYGADPALVLAMINRESSGNVKAKSKAGATGLMQLMPGTAEDLGVNPLDPTQNIDGGVRYITQLLERYGNLTHALAAYNWGMGKVDKWIKKGGNMSQLPKETQDYVKNVTQVYQELA